MNQRITLSDNVLHSLASLHIQDTADQLTIQDGEMAVVLKRLNGRWSLSIFPDKRTNAQHQLFVDDPWDHGYSDL